MVPHLCPFAWVPQSVNILLRFYEKQGAWKLAETPSWIFSTEAQMCAFNLKN